MRIYWLTGWLFLWAGFYASIQAKEKWFFNDNWIRVKTQNEASFFRIVDLDDQGNPQGEILDYYLTGELQGEGKAIYLDPVDDSKSRWDGKVLIFHKNGQKSSERSHKKGVLEGLALSWYENGQIQERMSFKANQPDGERETWYPNGKKKLTAFFVLGKGEGLQQSWYENGQLEQEFILKNDQRNGLYRAWHENGSMAQKSHFINDMPDGEILSWYSTGKFRKQAFYQQGLKTGIHRYWHEDGALAFQGSYQNDLPEGIHRSFHPNKQIASDVTFRAGKEQTHYRSWYPNGQKESDIPFLNGICEGSSVYWYDNGQKSSEIPYQKNQREGSATQWYENGKIQSRMVYQNDRLADKQFTAYDEYGRSWQEFHENFADTTNPYQWPIENSETATKMIITDSGLTAYALSSNSEKPETALINIPYQNPNLNFSLEADLAIFLPKDNDYYYGLIFGLRDWQNHYSIMLNGQHQFKISHYIEGVELLKSGWQTCPAIKNDDVNTLKVIKTVIKAEEVALFFINGNEVGNCEFNQFYGNYFGFMVSPYHHIVADNLIIKDLSSTGKASTTQADGWAGNGSGVFVHENGYILTNYHVISKASEIQIVYRDHQNREVVHSAKVERTDPQNDLAIIRIVDRDYTPLSILPYTINFDMASIGERVYTLGYPYALSGLGREVKVTDGLISSQTGYQDDITCYQISVPVQPGNSGGPLFNSRGELIGIVNANVPGMDNVSYAIKSNYIKNLLDLIPRPSPVSSRIFQNTSLQQQVKILLPYVVLVKIK